jgi:site-specific DNA-cytosine methylase
VKHGRRCRPVQADLHIAGSPCQDHSKLGARTQMAGPRSRFFFAWAAHRLDGI